MKYRIPKDLTTAGKGDECPTIMIVDDEPNVLKVLKELLSKDYTIITAPDGQKALEQLKGKSNPEEISLIICDQRMPGMTGVGLLTELAYNQIMPDTLRIILTAYDDKEVIISAINDANIYKFILKPYDPDALRIAVQRAVESFFHQKELKKFRDALIDKIKEIDELKKRIEELTPNDSE